MSTHPQTPKIYLHSPPPTHKKYLPTPTTKSIPPSTSIYPYSPIKKHPLNPTHPHQSIKNVHPPPLTQSIPPPTTNNHNKVHPPICPKYTSTLSHTSPLTNKKCPPNPTHCHQSIKNVHPPPLTQNIPPHTINNHKKVSSSICPKHTSTLPLLSPLTNKKCPPSPTHPKYTTLNHTHPKYSFIQPHSNLTLQTAKLLSQTLTCLGWESSIKYLGGNQIETFTLTYTHTDTHTHLKTRRRTSSYVFHITDM